MSTTMASTMRPARASYDAEPGEETAASGSTSRTRARDVLRAQIDDVRVLGALLRPIAFTMMANLSITDAGIQVTTEADRSVQAIAYVSSSIFSMFEFEPPSDLDPTRQSQATSRLDSPQPHLDFDIDLQTLLECLNIFGGAPAGNTLGSFSSRDGSSSSSRRPWHGAQDDQQQPMPTRYQQDQKATSMRLRWRGVGYPLILLLEEQDVTTRCEIATFEPSYGTGLEYNQEDTQAQAILPSEYLFDALQSVDQSSCSSISILFSNNYSPQSTGVASSNPGSPTLKLTSDGDFGTAETLLPNDGPSSVLEKFTCARLTVNSYKWSHFGRLIKAVQYSVRSSIRVSERGLLSLQLMMPRGTGGGAVGPVGTNVKKSKTDEHGFLEFLVVPLDEDRSDDEEQDTTAKREGGLSQDDGEEEEDDSI